MCHVLILLGLVGVIVVGGLAAGAILAHLHGNTLSRNVAAIKEMSA